MTKVCTHCSNIARKRCTRCKIAYYCNSNCQNLDHKRHSHYCKSGKVVSGFQSLIERFIEWYYHELIIETPVGIVRRDEEIYLILDSSRGNAVSQPPKSKYSGSTCPREFMRYCRSIPELRDMSLRYFYTIITSGQCSTMTIAFCDIISKLMPHYEFHNAGTSELLTNVICASSCYLGKFSPVHIAHMQRIPQPDEDPDEWDVDLQRSAANHTILLLQFSKEKTSVLDLTCAQFSFFPTEPESDPSGSLISRYPYYLSGTEGETLGELYKINYFYDSPDPPGSPEELEAILQALTDQQLSELFGLDRLTLEWYLHSQRRIPDFITNIINKPEILGSK